MSVNWIAIIVAALIPMVVGFIWYNPNVFGKAWMSACGLSEEDVKGANMALIFGVSLILSLLLATGVIPVVIHQVHLYSLVMNQPGFEKEGSDLMLWLTAATNQHGDNFRTFGHGTFHGALLGLFVVLPVLGTNALFERKGFKYIAVNVGYWVVCLALMGGLISGWR